MPGDHGSPFPRLENIHHHSQVGHQMLEQTGEVNLSERRDAFSQSLPEHPGCLCGGGKHSDTAKCAPEAPRAHSEPLVKG